MVFKAMRLDKITEVIVTSERKGLRPNPCVPVGAHLILVCFLSLFHMTSLSGKEKNLINIIFLSHLVYDYFLPNFKNFSL